MQDELFMRLGSALNYAAFRGWYYDRKPRTPDELRFNRLTVQVNQYTERVLGIHKSPSDSYVPAYPAMARLREKIWEEYRKPHPNYRNLDRWENKFAKIYGATTTDPRQILVYTRASALSMEADLRDAENRGDKARQKQLGLERSRNANYMRSALVKNIGDPPIYVSAPANARQVIALMTDGTIKPLEYNAGRKRWEGNYDVPTTTREGRYEIHIIIIQQNGQRREYSVPYQVDTTAPTGNGQATVLSAHDAICLEINHGGDVARVLAILPWGEKVSLLPSTIQGARFYGTAQVPTKYRGKAFRVIYILTDRAHNRTTIEANATP